MIEDEYNILDAIEDYNIDRVREQIDKNPLCVNYVCNEDVPYRERYGVNCLVYYCNSVLKIVARKNYADIAQLLLEKGADPNKSNGVWGESESKRWWSPLMTACVYNSHETIKVLLNSEQIEVNAIINKMGSETLLHNMCSRLGSIDNDPYGVSETVKLLLTHRNCDINAQDIWNYTPLIQIAQNILTSIYRKGKKIIRIVQCNIDIMKLLITKGCDIYLEDKYGNTFMDTINLIDEEEIKITQFRTVKKHVNGIVATYSTLFNTCIFFIRNSRELFSNECLGQLVSDIRPYFNL